MSALLDAIRRARELDARQAVRVLSQLSEALAKEEPLVTLKDEPMIIVGDLHGDLDSLRHVLELAAKERVELLVFLGDYVDRGPAQADVFLTLILLKLEEPQRIVLLRGNHEPPPDLMPWPHDLPFNLRLRFPDGWREVYEAMFDAFQRLPVAALVPGRALLLHGGPPVNIKSPDDLREAPARHPAGSELEEILWNDPSDDVEEWCPSPRGAGKLFGPKVTDRALRALGVRMIIRGHEPCAAGHKLNHGGRVLTLFSRKGAPYFNEKAACLVLSPDMELPGGVEKGIRVW